MKKKQDKKNQRRAGFYWVKAKPFVSVTHILKVIDKPALRYWYAKQVYLAMAKDPTLDESQAMAAPYQRKEKAKSRGQTIHSIVEVYKKSGMKIDKVPKRLQGYLEAFNHWVDDNSVEVVEQEKTVISKEHRYAGTLDLLVRLNGSKDIWVVDIKTGKDIYPEVFLQLSAYQRALEEQGKKVDRIAALLLMKNGKYKFEWGQPAFSAFLAAKILWEWQNQDILKEVGYQKGGEYG